jgi:short-subunit dehydrogenase
MSEAQRVVLITGASSGLGEAMALACAAAGHCVALAARREERLQALAARIGRPEAALVLPGDVRDPEAIRAMVAATEARFGRIDALVANAGVGHNAPFLAMGEDELREQIDVNLVAVMQCCRAVLPGMLERGRGHLITISSVGAEIPGPGAAVYAATKAGVIAFSESLRREVEPRGVRVTTVLPGFIRTAMTAGVPMAMPEPVIVGRLVACLLRHPRRRAVIPRFYGAAIWLNRFAPSLVDRLIRRLYGRRADAGR